MDKLIYEIAGKKYLLFDYKTQYASTAKTTLEVVKKFGGIVQGGFVKSGWWSNDISMRFLIPEDRAVEFSNYEPSSTF